MKISEALKVGIDKLSSSGEEVKDTKFEKFSKIYKNYSSKSDVYLYKNLKCRGQEGIHIYPLYPIHTYRIYIDGICNTCINI